MRVLDVPAIGRLRCVLLVMLTITVQASLAHANPIDFSLQAGMPLAQVVAPAASGRLVLVAHNSEAAPAPATTNGFVISAAQVANEYIVTVDQPQMCQLPVFASDSFGLRRISFSSEPLEPGADLTCSYAIARKAASRSDLVITLCRPGDFIDCIFRYIAFGTLPDLSLHVVPTEQPAFGSLETTVRVTASNPSASATGDVIVATDCAEFVPGALFGPTPFDIDNDFPGACPTAEDNLACDNFTGQIFESKGFHIGSIPAQGEVSCLLKLRFRHPLTEPVSLGLQFIESFVPYAAGGIGFDANTGNDRALAGAAPSGTLTPTPAPLDARAYAWLALLLGIVGARSAIVHARARTE
jgi:hypothetical protein